MTEPKLCPTTLRWAAQHIRKFMDPDETRWVRIFTNETYEHAAESLDDWAAEAELAEARRKADPGCTCSPSPGAGTGDMLCPSCAGVYSAKFDAGLAASLEAAIELRAEDLRGTLALTADQDKVDEHYGRIAYEASVQHEEMARTAVGLGSWPGTPWRRMGRAEQESWTAAAQAVAKAMKTVRGGS